MENEEQRTKNKERNAELRNGGTTERNAERRTVNREPNRTSERTNIDGAPAERRVSSTWRSRGCAERDGRCTFAASSPPTTPQTASPCTVPSSRIVIPPASKATTGYIGSTRVSPDLRLHRLGDGADEVRGASTTYRSARNARISRTVMPRAESARLRPGGAGDMVQDLLREVRRLFLARTGHRSASCYALRHKIQDTLWLRSSFNRREPAASTRAPRSCSFRTLLTVRRSTFRSVVPSLNVPSFRSLFLVLRS
jgi:hypothetical protein